MESLGYLLHFPFICGKIPKWILDSIDFSWKEARECVGF